MDLDESFWTENYLAGTTGWDIGYVSTPIKEYVDQLTDKNSDILIPGGGNSYEAEYLHKQGFKNVFVVDFSPIPLQNLAKRVPTFPKENLLNQNFFDLKGQYDLIIEQTFLSALNPKLRDDYVVKMHDLLKPGGKLVGLLFNIPLNDDRPPFGGSKEVYEVLYKKKFKIEVMETAHNSIPPRAGNELFIMMKRTT